MTRILTPQERKALRVEAVARIDAHDIWQVGRRNESFVLWDEHSTYDEWVVSLIDQIDNWDHPPHLPQEHKCKTCGK